MNMKQALEQLKKIAEDVGNTSYAVNYEVISYDNKEPMQRCNIHIRGLDDAFYSSTQCSFAVAIEDMKAQVKNKVITEDLTAITGEPTGVQNYINEWVAA